MFMSNVIINNVKKKPHAKIIVIIETREFSDDFNNRIFEMVFL